MLSTWKLSKDEMSFDEGKELYVADPFSVLCVGQTGADDTRTLSPQRCRQREELDSNTLHAHRQALRAVHLFAHEPHDAQSEDGDLLPGLQLHAALCPGPSRRSRTARHPADPQSSLPLSGELPQAHLRTGAGPRRPGADAQGAPADGAGGRLDLRGRRHGPHDPRVRRSLPPGPDVHPCLFSRADACPPPPLSSCRSPDQQWSLLPNHAVMSAVRPAYFCYGQGAYGQGGYGPSFPA